MASDKPPVIDVTSPKVLSDVSDEPKDGVVTSSAETTREVAQKRDLQRMLAEINFIYGEVIICKNHCQLRCGTCDETHHWLLH